MKCDPGVLQNINRRVNLSGTEEPIVQRFGEDRIVVQLPGAGNSITNVEFSEPTSVADLVRHRGPHGAHAFVEEATTHMAELNHSARALHANFLTRLAPDPD